MAGRRSSAEEWGSRTIAVKAIEAKYGSLEAGVEALLRSGEPSLLKWVFEHALGKPIEKIQLDGETDNKLEIIVKYAEKDINAT